MSAFERTQLARYEENRFTLTADPLREGVVRAVRPSLTALLALGLVVAFVVTANLATLIAARARSQASEVRVRQALGASRGQLLMQSILESGLVTAAGVGLGLVAAAVAVEQVSTHGLSAAPILGRAAIGPWALAYGGAIGFFTMLLLGVLPAIMAPRDALPPRDRGSAGSVSATLFRDGIAIGQVALSVTLLAGSTLMIKTVARLAEADLGLTAQDATTFSVRVPQGRYPDAASWTGFINQVADNLEAVPGVTRVGTTNVLPLTGPGTGAPYEVGDVREQATMRVTSRGFLGAIGGRLLAGRYFDAQDDRAESTAIVVNEALVRTLGSEPGPSIGRRIRVFQSRTELEIVGVVANMPLVSPGEPPRPEIHFSAALFPGWPLQFVVRGRALRAETVSDRVAALDPVVTVDEFRPLLSYLRGAHNSSGVS